MSAVDASRYEGKPFLRLLDAYVLWAIGALDDDTAARLKRMTPKLQETFKKPGATWFEIVEGEMDFPETLPATLSSSWEKNARIAAERNEILDPVAFAHRTVDENFRE
jgi:hypothetical protein